VCAVTVVSARGERPAFAVRVAAASQWWRQRAVDPSASAVSSCGVALRHQCGAHGRPAQASARARPQAVDGGVRQGGAPSAARSRRRRGATCGPSRCRPSRLPRHVQSRQQREVAAGVSPGLPRTGSRRRTRVAVDGGHQRGWLSAMTQSQPVAASSMRRVCSAAMWRCSSRVGVGRAGRRTRAGYSGNDRHTGRVVVGIAEPARPRCRPGCRTRSGLGDQCNASRNASDSRVLPVLSAPTRAMMRAARTARSARLNSPPDRARSSARARRASPGPTGTTNKAVQPAWSATGPCTRTAPR